MFELSQDGNNVAQYRAVNLHNFHDNFLIVSAKALLLKPSPHFGIPHVAEWTHPEDD